MAVASSSSTALISAALPEKGAMRLATQLLLAVAGSLLLIASAKTKVMLGPVDMSLQTLAVLGIAAAYGMRLGLATILLYMAQGAMGYPVFQSTPEKGLGIAYMLGSTGGYLAGFVAMVAIVGWAVDRGWGRSIVKMLGAMLVAEVVMMAMGFSWLSLLIGAEKSWQFGVVPFIVPDLIKVALAAAAVPAIWALLPKKG
ncbi:biotin transporter BioY [Aminobacter sp. DSM 101952]|uniref:biotin transporter BioY n=1 Tax=Aminobacter sp. DSM 101952 TaxID=2735891 RepID=UPI0006F406C5|nr:biotin transporter BioY [Aminobacter sp. DSM 101952]KQU66875.1 biotin transporter BioY [Aminobacter sp. DSM 101952]